MLATLVISACGDGDAPNPSNDQGGSDAGNPPEGIELTASIHPPDTSEMYLVQQLDVETTAPSTITAAITGPDGPTRTIAWPAVGQSFQLPLVGLLAETEYSVVVTATSDEGEAATDTFTFTNGPLPALFPQISVLVHDVANSEPGYVVVTPDSPGTVGAVAVLDGEGRPVWAHVPKSSWKAVFPTGAGSLMALAHDEIVELDWLGNNVRLYGDEVKPPGFQTDFGRLNHEIVPLADGGFYTLAATTEPVLAYPVDYDRTAFADVLVTSHEIKRVSADGTTLETFRLIDLLSPTRIGFNSLDYSPGRQEYDWIHANAVGVDLSDDSLIVSVRHQDAIAKIDRVSGELKWIFGQPDGWPPKFEHLLFSPSGDDFQWPGHQHAPVLVGDKLMMFDNGNSGRSNPYSDANQGPEFSRVVEFSLDTETMTATQDWEFKKTSTGELYSLAVGNADRLPTTGNVLATFSFLRIEGGVANIDAGLGSNTTRIIEFAPSTGETVRDWRLSGEMAEVLQGWQVDRAVHLPSLYGSTAVETLAD